MRVVVSYDITDDVIRRKVGKVCEAFGQRVQRSVFECALTSEQLQQLTSRLEAARKSGDTCPTDSIRLYSLCANCAISVAVLGYKPDIATESGYTVI